MKKVLLHMCCGPCAIAPVEALRRQGFWVEGFFYNPNIQPYAEYEKRKEALLAASRFLDVRFSEAAYEDALYESAVKDIENRQTRCEECFRLRLSKTMQYATENSFDYFTTTLLVSPYQNHELLRNIGALLAENEPVEFLYSDFRLEFKKAQQRARERELYLQNYCGCLLSLEERRQAKQKKKASLPR